MKKSTETKTSGIIGLIICLILFPILIFNIFLVARYYSDSNWLPEIGGYIPLVVLSGSMEPCFELGDLLISKKADTTDIAVGDIITFRIVKGERRSVVSHRVVDIKKMMTQSGGLPKVMLTMKKTIIQYLKQTLSVNL